jgi:hypothetical protein
MERFAARVELLVVPGAAAYFLEAALPDVPSEKHEMMLLVQILTCYCESSLFSDCTC